MKNIILGATALLVLTLTAISPAFASTPVVGTFPPTTTLYSKFTSPTTITLKSEGNFTGGITGTYTAYGNVTLTDHGLVGNYVAIDVCYCTIGQPSGVLYHYSLYEVGTVHVTNIKTGAAILVSTSTVIPNPSGITGNVNFTGVANVFTFVNSGVYTGVLNIS